ncbi:sugar O-acetyltransferase [Cellulomonas sp. NPDC058312]|uniref:sugar O-acetyltransferase n=1 Tax=Cellulomonas sp. NPDC058312 TaxID=3346441 RepID=UPI0036E2311C
MGRSGADGAPHPRRYECSSLQSPFRCDDGKNIRVGADFLCNYNVTTLDVAPVTIGDHCMIGPNTVISTVGHPLTPQGRRDKLAVATPVTIGDDVWIGANCTILPGVTIGDRVIVAAGAVVSRKIPNDTTVAGVPRAPHPERTGALSGPRRGRCDEP